MAPARLGNPSDDPQHSRAHRHPRYTDGTDTPTSAAPVQSTGPSTSRPTAATTTSTRSTVLPVKERTERLFEYLHASCLALESLHAAGATSTLKENTLYVERVATLLGAITPVPLQRLLLLDEARTGGRVGAPDMDASKAGERAGTKGSGLTDSLSATKRTVQLVRVDEEVVGRSTESRPTMKSSKRDVEDERGDKLGARSRTTATLVQMTAVPSDASTSSSNVSFSSAVSDNPRAATSATGVTNPISPSPAAPHLLKSPINKLLHKKSSTSFTLVKSRSMTHLAPVTAPPVRHRGTVHLLRDYSTSLSPSSCSNDASQVGFSRSEVGYTRALKGYFGKSLGGAMDSVKVEVNEGKDALEIYTTQTNGPKPSISDRDNSNNRRVGNRFSSDAQKESTWFVVSGSAQEISRPQKDTSTTQIQTLISVSRNARSNNFILSTTHMSRSPTPRPLPIARSVSTTARMMRVRRRRARVGRNGSSFPPPRPLPSCKLRTRDSAGQWYTGGRPSRNRANGSSPSTC